MFGMRGSPDEWVPRIGALAYRRARQADKFAKASIAALVVMFGGLGLPGRRLSARVAVAGFLAWLITFGIACGLTLAAQRAALSHTGMPRWMRTSMSPGLLVFGRYALRDPASFDEWLAQQRSQGKRPSA